MLAQQKKQDQLIKTLINQKIHADCLNHANLRSKEEISALYNQFIARSSQALTGED